jgi:hypothetical protein
MNYFFQTIRNLSTLECIARIGIFGTFFGHGIVAFGINIKWISLITAFGFSDQQALTLMPYIGIADILVAVSILLFPIRIVILWAFVWAFLTSLSRPLSGLPVVEFIERASNWAFPLALLIIQGFPKTMNDLFSVRSKVKDLK